MYALEFIVEGSDEGGGYEICLVARARGDLPADWSEFSSLTYPTTSEAPTVSPDTECMITLQKHRF